ncbi:unnamed protein product [Gadus morhua 'NCC']
MDPPAYEEVVLQTPPTPPPTYALAVLPSTPPPTYREADAFPVLNLPVVQAVTILPVQGPATQTPVNGTSQNGSGPTVFRVQPQRTRAVMGVDPVRVQCPYCHEVVTTEIEHKPGLGAWSMCFLFTLVGCICGCCLIPFVAKEMQDVHHSCPRCQRHLHIHAR